MSGCTTAAGLGVDGSVQGAGSSNGGEGGLIAEGVGLSCKSIELGKLDANKTWNIGNQSNLQRQHHQ